MVKASRIFILTAVAASAFPVFAGEWSERAEVRGRRGAVVAYRAKVDGDTLIVEVAHEPGWHTYAMDNVRRAQEKTGKEQPETELPTVIAVTGGLSVEGNWRQTKPAELSQEAIQWYTWGFEKTARFAVKVSRSGDAPALIAISGQACNATACSMVDGIAIALTLKDGDGTGASGFALSDLVEVRKTLNIRDNG